MININRLQYFITVKKTESIRKASEILCISPAALSKAIKQLEFDVGHTLFVPFGRGIIATEQAERLAVQVEPLLEGLQQLKRTYNFYSSKQDITPKKIVRLGSFEIFTTHFVNKLISVVPADYELQIYELLPGQIEDALIEGRINYGITCVPIPTDGLSHKRIVFTQMRIFGLSTKFMHMKFEDLPFAVPMQELNGPSDKFANLDCWPENQKRLVKYRVSMLESALALCRSGHSVAFLPKALVNLHNECVQKKYQLTELPSPENMIDVQQPVYVVGHLSSFQHPILKEIEGIVELIYGN